MTKDDFESFFRNSRGLSKEQYNGMYVTLKCNCGYSSCKGFASVFNNKKSIDTHNSLYNSEL